MAEVPKGQESVAQILKRFKGAESSYNAWRSLHQEAMDYCNPNRETFTIQAEGQRKNHFVFDDTAIEGVQQFASRIQSSLMPSWSQWMDLVAGDDIGEKEKPEVDKALAKTTKTFFTNLNHSNFDTEITPALQDLAIGTGAILIEDNTFTATNSALKFTNIPLAELYSDKSRKGFWRKQKVEAINLVSTWPDMDVPEQLKKIIDNDPNKLVEIINGFLINEQTEQYDHLVIWKKELLFTQSFKTQRLIVFRWSVTPGETYGRGPAIKKLPTIRTANKIKEIILGNAALQMSGVYTAKSDGIFNPHTARVAPGGIIPVSSNDNSNPTLRALTPSGNIGIGAELLQIEQNEIRKAFFSSPLGDVTDPVRSATENIMRMQEFLKDSGASIGRLKSELIEPLVAAGIDILKERGKVADIRVDGNEVTINQNSPLAKAEGTEDFQTTQLWISTLAQFIPQEILAAKIKVEDLPKKFQEQLGIDPSLLRSDAETRELGKQIQQAAQKQLEGGLSGEQQQPV